MSNRKYVATALIAVVVSMSMVMLIQNAQTVKADVPDNCKGNPHDDGETGHRSHHHDPCPGDK